MKKFNAVYSPMHKMWVVSQDDRPDLVYAYGSSKPEAEDAAKARYEVGKKS